jgi:hypothetical protein
MSVQEDHTARVPMILSGQAPGSFRVEARTEVEGDPRGSMLLTPARSREEE